jgi:diguanylate cyclase (GGDEF)-like protein/PAS domain S-box-containing protein
MPDPDLTASDDVAMRRAAGFEHAFEHGQDPQVLIDDAHRVLAINAAARRRLTQPDSGWEGTPVDALLAAPGDGPDPWRTIWASASAPAGTRLRLAAGEYVVSVLVGTPGAAHVLTLRDAERVADDRADRLVAVVDSSHDAVLALDRHGCVTAISARAELVLGYSERALSGRPLSVVVLEHLRAETDAMVRAALDGRDVFQHDTQARHRDGHVVDITVNLAPLRMGAHGIAGVSVIVQDITERKRLERELRHRSERDPLTELFNRRRFDTELQRAVRLAERHGDSGAVVLLDLDDFKLVNDTRGHPAGDRLLRDLAVALAHSVRETDVVARLGGDEFAVLLLNVDEPGATAAAEKVLAATSTALRDWEAGVSMGAARFGPETTFDPEAVLVAADRALYLAKGSGGNRLHADG